MKPSFILPVAALAGAALSAAVPPAAVPSASVPSIKPPSNKPPSNKPPLKTIKTPEDLKEFMQQFGKPQGMPAPFKKFWDEKVEETFGKDLVLSFSKDPFKDERREQEGEEDGDAPEDDDEDESAAASSVSSHKASSATTFLTGDDAAFIASIDFDTAGAAAWAAVHADLRAALIASTAFTAEDADLYPATLKWAGARVESKTEEVSASALVEPGKARQMMTQLLEKQREELRADAPPAPPGGRPRPAVPDFHVGISAGKVCEYLIGAAWKVTELRRPVEQLSPEYVPWLVQNKGPYIYILDGLREIEWTFWQLARGLEYASSFTEEEQVKIARCQALFTGTNLQLTTVPPRGPGPVIVDRPLPTTTAAPAPVPQTTLPTPQPTILPRDNAAEDANPPRPSGVNPTDQLRLIGLFGFRSFLRHLQEQAPASKYQTYANVRIARVLTNLDSSLQHAGLVLDEKLSSPRAQEVLTRSEFSAMYEQLRQTIITFSRNP